MHRSEKIDPTASERLVFFAFPQKLSIIHNNGNFICRWREKMLDVSQHIKEETFLTQFGIIPEP